MDNIQTALVGLSLKYELSNAKLNIDQDLNELILILSSDGQKVTHALTTNLIIDPIAIAKELKIMAKRLKEKIDEQKQNGDSSM